MSVLELNAVVLTNKRRINQKCFLNFFGFYVNKVNSSKYTPFKIQIIRFYIIYVIILLDKLTLILDKRK